MCLTGPLQYRWLKGYIYSSCYHQMGSIHLSNCYHIFPWLCIWDVCYIIYFHLLHIRSEKTGNLFSLLLCSSSWVQIVGYVLVCRSYLFVCTVHHLIIIIAQHYLEPLNQLSIIRYVGLCVFSLPISLVMIDIIYILCLIIIIKSEIWTITHCLGLGHETIVCTMSFYILLNMWWVIARTSSWLTDTRTHTQTDRIRQWQYPKAVTGLG